MYISISIHALREEGDTRQSIIFCGSLTFLSTPSVRRATAGTVHAHFFCHISIHALREEGDECIGLDQIDRRISIHALREEGDMRDVVERYNEAQFLSTPSVRRATTRAPADRAHALDFYPRPP